MKPGTQDLPRPAAAKTGTTSGHAPSEVNPDLANIEMAKSLIQGLGMPSIVSKKFIVRYGIYSALNHQSVKRDQEGKITDKGNPTGYDSSLRLMVYESVARNSVNVNGQYFEKIWAYLMKPKYIIQGMQFGQNSFEDEQGGTWMDWIKSKVTGEKPEASNAA